MEEEQLGCEEDIVSGDRIKLTYQQLKKKYDLIGPVAGNIMKVTDNGEVTNDLLCRITKLSGKNPFQSRYKESTITANELKTFVLINTVVNDFMLLLYL